MLSIQTKTIRFIDVKGNYMIQKKKRLASAFMAVLAFVSAILIGCQSGDKPNPNTSNVIESNSTGTSDKLIANIPDDVDMKGQTFTVMSASWYGYDPLSVVDIFPESDSEEAWESKAYFRAIKVQEQLKCNIVHNEAASLDDFIARLQQDSVVEKVNDVVMIRGTHLLTAIMADYLTDLGDLEYADYSAPWWGEKSNDQMKISGKLYAAYGDVSLNSLMAAQITIYNKEMMQDLKLGSMYEIVKSGAWTVDKMFDMAKSATNDVDMSGDVTLGDRVGATYFADGFVPLLNCAGVQTVMLDNDGMPRMSANDEKMITRIQKITEMMNDTRYIAEVLRQKPDLNGRWSDGEVLFHLTATHQSNSIRDCETDVGIAPLPKYSENEEYAGSVQSNYVSFVAVPSSNTDFKNTGIFLELMAYLGYTDVRPEFYERMLLRKTARDDESAELLDMIYTGMVFDLGAIYGFGDVSGALWNLVAYPAEQAGVVSTLAGIESQVTESINAFIQKIKSGN